MAYLALAYPVISEDDFYWIQNLRKVHDTRYYSVVEPHFTIVFGTDKLSLTDFTNHIKDKVKKISAFEFTLSSALVVEDDSKKFFHAFLVPKQGYDEVNYLHDILYSDELASELREDIPFIPHVGIGTNESKEVMDKLVSDINSQETAIKGRVNSLTIIEFDGQKVTNLEEVPLQKRS